MRRELRNQKFPRQSNKVGKKVLVAIEMDLSNILKGEIVRDDEVAYNEHPITIIHLDKFPNQVVLEDHYILGSECHWQLVHEEKLKGMGM